MQARLGRWARVAAATVAIAAATYFLVTNVVAWTHSVGTSGFPINLGMLVLATVVNMVCSLLGGWEWTIILRSLGHRLAVRPGVKIQTRANLAKYIPGFAWQVVGKVYLSVQHGVPRSTGAVSIAAEFGVIIGTGVLIVLAALPSSDFLTLSAVPRQVLQLCASVAVVLILWLHPFPLSWLARRLGLTTRLPVLARVDWRTWRLGVTAVLLTWVLLGVGFCLTVAAVRPVQLTEVPTIMVALAASFIFSLLVVFVPNGYGVREASLGVLLGQVMPLSTASVIAILARLSLAAGEVLSFLVTALYRTDASRKKTSGVEE